MGNNRVSSCGVCRNLPACGKYIPAQFRAYHLVRLARACTNPKQSRLPELVAVVGAPGMDWLVAEDLVRAGQARWTPEGELELMEEIGDRGGRQAYSGRPNNSARALAVSATSDQRLW